jgi:hypothetical protein
LKNDSTDLGTPSGDLSPYFGFIIAIDPETVFVTRTNMVLAKALSNVGVLIGVLILLFKLFISYVSQK